MDASQKPAEPLKPMSPAAFVRKLENPEAEPGDSDEQKENRARAAQEVSMIFELKDLAAFKWFCREFIDTPYSKAFAAYRDPTAKTEDLPGLRTRYQALREIKVGILEREISHREEIDPNDQELKSLREMLASL